MREFVDRALDRSRAILTRQMRAILVRFAPIPGTALSPETAMSRATLAAQVAETMRDSGVNMAEPSRMSLGDRRAP
jgi:hypothetical protein